MDKGWRLQKEKNWSCKKDGCSHQSPVTSQQGGIYQTDEQRYQKRREGGYLSDTID